MVCMRSVWRCSRRDVERHVQAAGDLVEDLVLDIAGRPAIRAIDIRQFSVTSVI